MAYLFSHLDNPSLFNALCRDERCREKKKINEDVSNTALKIIGLSDTGRITLGGIEQILGEFIARGIAAQKAADDAIAAAQSKLATD